MNRTLKALAAAALATGLVLSGGPVLGTGGEATTLSGGSSGCCKQ